MSLFMHSMDCLEQLPSIRAALDYYPLFAQPKNCLEKDFARMLDRLDRAIRIPVPFAEASTSHAPSSSPSNDPSQLFWHRKTPSIVTEASSSPEGIRISPTFKSLTFGIDPSEFKPFSPPTCPVPFGSPFTADSDLDAPSESDAVCDSGYESDKPVQQSGKDVTDYNPTFRFPTPDKAPSPALPRPQSLKTEDSSLPRLSEKELGKRRAMLDGDDSPVRKRARDFDDGDYSPDHDADGPKGRSPSRFAAPSRSPSPVEYEIPRQRERALRTFRCIIKDCDKSHPTFAASKDRNRHMDTHFEPRFKCQNPQCGKRFHRDDALKRHCKDAKTGGCAQYWTSGVDYSTEQPYWRTCPLDELIQPDKRDPLFKEFWQRRT